MYINSLHSTTGKKGFPLSQYFLYLKFSCYDLLFRTLLSPDVPLRSRDAGTAFDLWMTKTGLAVVVVVTVPALFACT